MFFQDSPDWAWTVAQRSSVLSAYNNLSRQTSPPGMPTELFSVPRGTSAQDMENFLIAKIMNPSYVNANGVPIKDGTIGFHGIVSSGDTDDGVGGVSLADFNEFLDYVFSVKDDLWIAGSAERYKYAEEYTKSTVTPVTGQQCLDRIYFDFALNTVAGSTVNMGPYTTDTTDPSYPITALDPILFDEPITIIADVPADWGECRAVQDNMELPCTIDAATDSAMVDAVPNQGHILIVKK